MKLYIVHTHTIKRLKDSGRYMTIWKTIQGVGGHWLLKNRQQLLEFVKLRLETIKWPLNWWRRKCHILPEQWETGKSECNLFHTISWMNIFRQDCEALSGESQLGGDKPLTFFTWPHVSQLLSAPSSEKCSQSYKISGCHDHQVEHNNRVAHSSFGCTGLLIFKTFIIKWKSVPGNKDYFGRY